MTQLEKLKKNRVIIIIFFFSLMQNKFFHEQSPVLIPTAPEGEILDL